LLSPYAGGGDIITTLSPLTTMDPRLFESPSEGISSDWSSSRFMCWSKPRRLPRMVLFPFSL